MDWGTFRPLAKGAHRWDCSVPRSLINPHPQQLGPLYFAAHLIGSGVTYRGGSLNDCMGSKSSLN